MQRSVGSPVILVNRRASRLTINHRSRPDTDHTRSAH